VTERETHRTRLEWLLIAGLVIVALVARLMPGERMVDDAYITFRYARNIVEGVGFVYNPDEHVLGTTTPLYTLLMAGLALATGSCQFPVLALITNALAGAISVGTLYALGKRFADHPFPAAAVALLWALAPFSVSFAIGGLETDLTIGLLIATAYAHLTERLRAMAVLSALALLARPDTAIFLGPLWLSLILTQRHIPWREGLIALTVLAPWLIFGMLYFGSPLTNSVAAKSVAYRLPPTAGAVRLLQHYATPFSEDKVLSPYGVLAVFALYCGLCTLGAIHAFRRERKTWPLIVYPFAYFAVFALANPLIFRWYLSPPLPFYFLLIITGAWTAGRDIGRLVFGKLGNWESRQLTTYQFTNLPFIIFAAAVMVLTLNAWTLHPDHGPDRPAPKMAWFKLEQLYAKAADIVRSRANPGDTLCAGDIGMLGYQTGLHIIDTVGLVTPESSLHYPTDPDIYVINYAIPADLVLALDPDYVVILEVYGRKGLLPNPQFRARYRLLKKLETNIYGSDGMLIFERSAPSSDPHPANK
jgi:hypothetical protein